jgi:general secretion pathway protein G
VVSSKAFTLVELMIVVSILGILAAVVLPEFQGQQQRAKEAAAKANLQLLRAAIERYAVDHNGVPPGHAQDNPENNPHGVTFAFHLRGYLSKQPKNPYNNLGTTWAMPNNGTFPETAPGLYGWIYHAPTKTIKLDWPGTDSEGRVFFDY